MFGGYPGFHLETAVLYAPKVTILNYAVWKNIITN